MALTRAQLLMGNDQQGAVLPGEVQAVKQGAGIFIDTDGTISVDASTVVGLVRLNNPSGAFNNYVWPGATGTTGQFLSLGTGNQLVWANAGVFVSGSAPLNPTIGSLWFDCNTGQLLVYESCTSGSPKWTSGSEGFPVNPGNSQFTPAPASGNGTVGNPYILTATSTGAGSSVVVTTVQITGLAPFQFVPIVDLNAFTNGGRFSFTNNVANGVGTLEFDVLFTDSPASGAGQSYTLAMKIGYGSIYANATVTVSNPMILVSPGSISGTAAVGNTLNYTQGSATGGTGTITYTWQWKDDDGFVLAGSVPSYLVTSNEVGNTISVTLTAQDGAGQTVSGTTAATNEVAPPPFPNPTPPSFPTNSVTGESSFTWDGANETLISTGCIQFKVDTGSFGQGPTPVLTGQTVTTRWATGPAGQCGDAPNGDTITGALTNQAGTAAAVASLQIDRVPGPFSFTSASNVAPSTVAISNSVTPTDYNAAGYITLVSTTGSAVEANVNGAGFVAVPASGTSLPISPGQTLVVRFTVGSGTSSTYNAVIAIGQGTSVQTATFTATTAGGIFPNTFVVFPTFIPEVSSFTWADGSTNILTTGCIELSLDGNSFTSSSTPVQDNDTVYLRWKTTPACGAANTGTITGSITNNTYINSDSLSIDRVPGAYSFTNVPSGALGSVVASDTISITDTTAPAYLTYVAANTTLTTPQYSIDGGSTWASIPTSGTTASVPPDAAFKVRGKTGLSTSTGYTLALKLGAGGTTTDTTWTVTTSTSGIAQPEITTIVGVDGNSYSAPTEPSYVTGSIPGAVAPPSAVSGLTPSSTVEDLPTSGGSGTGLTVTLGTDSSGSLSVALVSTAGSGYSFGDTVTVDASSIGGSATQVLMVYTQPVTSTQATFTVTSFNGVSAGSFSQAEFQFDTSPSFTSPTTVNSTINSTTQQITVPSVIPPGTPYYVRFRYLSTTAVLSPYSLTVRAVTAPRVEVRYIFKNFPGRPGPSYDSSTWFVEPKPYLYLVVIDNTGKTSSDAIGLNTGPSPAGPSTSFRGRAGVYLQLRQPCNFRVTAVGPGGAVTAVTNTNVAYGLNDYYNVTNPAPVTGGSGTGCTLSLSRNATTGRTTLNSIVSGGTGYVVNDVITFTPPIGNGNNRAGVTGTVTGFQVGTLDSFWDVMIHGLGEPGTSSAGGCPPGAGGGYLTQNGQIGNAGQGAQCGGNFPGGAGIATYTLYGNSGNDGPIQTGMGGYGFVNGQYGDAGGAGGASFVNQNFVTNGGLSGTSFPQEGVDVFINGIAQTPAKAEVRSYRLA